MQKFILPPKSRYPVAPPYRPLLTVSSSSMIKKDDKVYLQAGAGIVADSKPEMEYQECCNKVMALAKTLVKEEHL